MRRAEWRSQIMVFGLTVPAILFVLAFFVVPIGLFLFNSVNNPEVPSSLRRTLATLESWDARELPPEASYEALAHELDVLAGSTELVMLGRRLNYNIPGFRGLIIGTADRATDNKGASYKDHLIALDPRWGDMEYWGVIKSQGGRLTWNYLLAALDLQYAADGSLKRTPAEEALFLDLLGRTVWISFTITMICLVAGFPVAVVLASASAGAANVLLVLVLVPFWTSLLVRTTAWVILLQNMGVVNQALIFAGLLDEPLPLIFNRTGLYIAMVHILSPFMILPLYSVLKGIPRDNLRAAASLGAKPSTVFWRVYLPQAMPGIAAGCTLVFVLSLGFYVTPALVGGPGDQMIGYFIAHFTNRAVNWGMAAALATILLVTVVIMFAAISRAVGVERMRIR